MLTMGRERRTRHEKEGAGVSGADPGHHGGGSAVHRPAGGVNRPAFVHTRACLKMSTCPIGGPKSLAAGHIANFQTSPERENTEKCEVISFVL